MIYSHECFKSYFLHSVCWGTTTTNQPFLWMAPPFGKWMIFLCNFSDISILLQCKLVSYNTLFLSLYCFLMWLQVSEYKRSLLWPAATAALSKSFFTDTVYGGSQKLPKLSLIWQHMINKSQRVSIKLAVKCLRLKFNFMSYKKNEIALTRF